MAIIQFSNGAKVNFNGTPTAQDVEEVARQLGLSGTPTSTKAPNLMDRLSGAVSGGIQAFQNLPGIKQAGQLGGKVVGGLSGEIGAAVAEIGTPIANLAQGKPLFQNIEKNVARQRQMGQELGQTIGEQGVTSAPLGGLGRIPNAIIAGTQLYEGVKTGAEGLREGNKLKVLEGAGQTAMGAVGAKYAFAKGKQGAFINPDAVKQVKSEIKFLKGSPSLSAAKNKAAQIYRDVLRPTVGEVKNFEVRNKKDMNNAYGLMAERKVQVQKGADNKLDTKGAADQLRGEIDKPYEMMQEALKSKPDQTFDLNVLKEKVKARIDEGKEAAIVKNQKKADVDEFLDAEIEARGIPEGEPALVSGQDYNSIKQGAWKMGYNLMKPTANKTARLIGHEISTDIKSTYKGTPVEPLNQYLATLQDAIQLLENAHGRVIKGGRLDQRLAGMTGAIIGATTKVPVVGPVIGEMAGRGLYNYRTNPERLTNRASNLLSNARKSATEKLPGSILERLSKTKPGLTIEKVNGQSIQKAKQSGQSFDDVLDLDFNKTVDSLAVIDGVSLPKKIIELGEPKHYKISETNTHEIIKGDYRQLTSYSKKGLFGDEALWSGDWTETPVEAIYALNKNTKEIKPVFIKLLKSSDNAREGWYLHPSIMENINTGAVGQFKNINGMMDADISSLKSAMQSIGLDLNDTGIGVFIEAESKNIPLNKIFKNEFKQLQTNSQLKAEWDAVIGKTNRDAWLKKFDIKNEQIQGDKSGKIFDAYYDAVTKNEPLFKDGLAQAASKVGGEYLYRMKSPESLKVKMSRKTQYTLGKVGDALGGVLIADDADAALAAAKSNFNITKIADNRAKPNFMGYKGVHLDVEMSNGQLTEVQIHSKKGVYRKEEAHKIYDKWKKYIENAMEEDVEKVLNKIPESVQAEFLADVKYAQDIYAGRIPVPQEIIEFIDSRIFRSPRSPLFPAGRKSPPPS
jgi:hypothetical protein